MKQFRRKTPSHSFSSRGEQILRTIFQDIEISCPGSTVKFKTKGIWDTGATATVITQEIFDHFSLKGFGMTQVSTASESNVLQPTYLIDVYLKPDLVVNNIEVTVGKVASDQGIHCLIGMDIITLGDFSITNMNGKTLMSFRVPSQHTVDFVRKMEAEEAIIQRHSANNGGMNTKCI